MERRSGLKAHGVSGSILSTPYFMETITPVESVDLYDVRDRYRSRVGYTKLGTQEYKVEIAHLDGGYNNFTGNKYAKGFYLLITPIERREGCESFTLLGERSGKKMLIEENNRYSAKRLKELSTSDTGTRLGERLFGVFGLPLAKFPAA